MQITKTCQSNNNQDYNNRAHPVGKENNGPGYGCQVFGIEDRTKRKNESAPVRFSISITEIEKFVFSKLDGMNAYHTKEVRKIGAILAEQEKADKTVVDIAIMFHDIDKAPEFKTPKEQHGLESARIAEKFMKDKRYPKEFIDAVVHCIRCHATPRRRNEGNPLGDTGEMPTTKEAKVVVDADILNNMSPFGVVKNVRKNANLEWKEAVAKLKRSFEIKHKALQTRSGRRMADPDKMKEFLSQVQ